MKLTRKDVEHVATLARLELTEEEMSRFTSQLESILGFIDQLSELDTKNIPPTSHPLTLQNVFREDVVKPWPEPEKLLDNAPEREGSLFKVAKVIE